MSLKAFSDAPSLRESPALCVPNVGDWFVCQTAFSYDIEGPITAITAQQVRFQVVVGSSYWRRCDLRRLVFAGSEKECRDLYSMIRGSLAKLQAANREAAEANVRRIEKAVAMVSNRKDGSSPKDTPT